MLAEDTLSRIPPQFKSVPLDRNVPLKGRHMSKAPCLG